MLKFSKLIRRSDINNLRKAQEIAEKKPPACCKCHFKPMEIGLIPETHHARSEPTRWLKAKAEGLGLFGLRIFGQEYLCVVTFRCPQCGYLESYAPDINP